MQYTIKSNGFEVVVNTWATKATRKSVARPKYLVQTELLVSYNGDRNSAAVEDVMKTLESLNDRGLWELCPDVTPDGTRLVWTQGVIAFEYEKRPRSVESLRREVKALHNAFVRKIKSVFKRAGLDYVIEDWPDRID